MKILEKINESKISICKHMPVLFGASALLMIASIVLVMFRGMNFGLDFSGGIEIEISHKEDQNLSADLVREILEAMDLGDYEVNSLDGNKSIAIRIENNPDAAENNDDVKDLENYPYNNDLSSQRTGLVDTSETITSKKITETLKERMSGIEVMKINTIGPKVSGELINKSIIALFLALASISVYIWFRFEWNFALAALMALLHDVLLTFGVLSLIQAEFTLSVIAAILTVIGYSLNDTIIVFDRVREEMKRSKEFSSDLLDKSIKKTLSRTFHTSSTTVIALIALFIFGGDELGDFSVTLIWGVFIGTYSSISIATAVIYFLPPPIIEHNGKDDGNDAKVIL